MKTTDAPLSSREASHSSDREQSSDAAIRLARRALGLSLDLDMGPERAATILATMADHRIDRIRAALIILVNRAEPGHYTNRAAELVVMARDLIDSQRPGTVVINADRASTVAEMASGADEVAAADQVPSH
jgi:hypothetical protein